MLALKPKQQTVIDAVNNPKISTIVLIGSVGTGKTDIAAHASICIAYTFPKSLFEKGVTAENRGGTLGV